MAHQTNHIGDTNKMLTAVEWFYQRILAEDIKSVFEQAKAMEKDQIENAYKNGLAGMLPEGVNKMTITRILE